MAITHLSLSLGIEHNLGARILTRHVDASKTAGTSLLMTLGNGTLPDPLPFGFPLAAMVRYLVKTAFCL